MPCTSESAHPLSVPSTLNRVAFSSCNNEERLCLGSTAIDSDFQNDYNCWHSVCDPIINYTPTSPQYSSITAPYDLNYCLTAQAACTQMSASRSQCALEYNSGDPTTSVSSCLCAPPVLSLEYTCSFLQNISCAQVPAHLSQIAGWTFCENLPDVLTVPASVVSSFAGHRSRSTVALPSLRVCPRCLEATSLT